MTADQTYFIGDLVTGDDIPDTTAKVVKVNKKTIVVELSDGNHILRHIHKHNFQLVQPTEQHAPSVLT